MLTKGEAYVKGPTRLPPATHPPTKLKYKKIFVLFVPLLAFTKVFSPYQVMLVKTMAIKGAVFVKLGH